VAASSRRPSRRRTTTTGTASSPPRVLADGETATVTALRSAGADRVSVLLDGEPALTLTAAAAIRLGLRRGVTVDADMWARASAAAAAEAAETAAARLLAARARTREDLRRRLAPRFPPAALRQALDHLQAIGAIDDEAFARRWLEARRGDRALSRQALIGGLVRAGIPAPRAKRLVAELAAPDEAAAALAVARTAAARYRRLPPHVAARRLWSYLARRGFGPEACSGAVRATLGGAEPEGGT
jgi:regulatory protein